MKRYTTLAAICLMMTVGLAPGVAGARGPAAVTAAADTTPPAVALTAPAADANVKGTITVAASATDAGGIAKVEFYADGALVATDTLSPYSWSWNTLNAPAGSHTLTAKAYDRAGNTTTSTERTVSVDNQRPAVQLTAPATGALLRGSVTVDATATDNLEVAKVEFLVDGVMKQRVTAAPYTWTWDTATATNASHSLTAKAYDASGNVTTSTALSVSVDNLAPAVRISAPAGNAIVKGTVTVTATASDTRMSRVEFYRDDTLVGTDTTSPYNYIWDTAAGTPGSHTLYATAYDVAGNSATSPVTTVTVDSAPPEVSLTNPVDGPVPSGTVTVQASASDDAAVAKVEFYLDNVLKLTDTTSPYSWDWVTTTATNGSHTLKAKVYDKVGNVTSSAPVTVAVDLPPTVSLTAPKSGSLVHGSIALTANATDALGVAQVEFYIDGTLAGSDTTAPFSIPWDTTQTASGRHTLTAKAFDASGNAATSAAVTVTVDNTAPVVSLGAPSDGATLTGTVNVTATATDNVAVAKVEFYLDDVLKATDTTSPYAWSWVTATAGNGSHTVKAKAYDTAGNATIASVNVTTDLPPVVSGLTVSSGATASGTVTVTAEATDATGVTRVDFYVDGALKGSAGASPYTWNWVTTDYTNASHTVMAKAYDAAGNSATKSVTVKVDNAAPTVAISAPAAGSAVPLKTTVTATAADSGGVTRVELYVDGTLAQTDTAAPYSWTWETTGLTAGAHVLTAKAYDAAGNVATSAPVSVTVDNEVPAISVTAPAYARQTVTVSATASDSTGVTKVEFYRNGTLAQTLTAAPYDWVWNTTTSTNSTYTITAKAYDAARNVTVSAPVKVTVDNQAPTVSLSSPAKGARVLGTVTVTAAASDSVGVARVEFYVDGSLVSTDTATPFTYAWDTTQATGGSHALTAKAYDTAGNVATATAVTVTVDNAAPTVSLTGLTDGATVTGTVTVGATAADETGLAKVEFYLDNVLKAADTATPFTWAWQTTTAPGGSHTVLAKAYDTAGNVTASLPVTVIVDLPPTATITNPKAGSLLRGTVAVTANAGDAVGVTKVELYVDGTTLVTSATASPYSLSWDTTQSANGSHSLTVKAYDAGGNVTTSSAVAVTVDNAAPVLALTVPADGTTVIGTVNATATATDNAAVTKVEFYLDGVLKATDSASPYTWSWVTTTATNGSHNVVAKAYDAAGNVTSATANVTVDLPPVVTGLTISSGANARGTVQVTAAATDAVGVTSVEFYVDGALKGTATASPYTWNWDTTGYTTGSHTVMAKVYDAAGNMTSSKTVSTKVDNGAPTVAVTAPAAGSAVGVTATITATAADNVAVTKVEFYADGTLLGSDVAAPYAWTWVTTGLTGGAHSVSAKAYDAAGNETTSALVAVTVDNAVPTVTVTAPTAGAALKQTVTVTADAADNTGVTKVDFYLDGVLKSTVTTAPYAWTWDTTTTSNAPHSLTAKAYDPTGNVATAAAVNVTVDNQAPVVGISTPANGAMVKGTVMVTANATDNRSVAQVEFFLDNISMQTVTTAPWSYAWDTTTASNGTYKWKAVARDAVGNETTSAETTISVDNTLPVVSLTGLTDGATVTGTVHLSLSATDNVSVTKTEFYLDGKVQKSCVAVSCQWDWVTTTATNGSHTVAAKAYDTAGNVAVREVTVTVDLPPTVSLTNPKANAALSGTVTATVTATDTVGVTKVELYANGALVATATASPFDLTWDTTAGANGSYTLAAKAYDAGGNVTTSAAVTVSVDNTLPVVSLTSPANGATLTGNVTVTTTATDNVGVTKVEFYLDGTLAATDTASPYAWSWTTATATDGSHIVEAKAYDAAGNVDAQAVGVTVDLAPTIAAVTLSNGANPARGMTTITVDASDPTGVTYVEVYVDGALKTTLTASPYAWVWDTTAYADGSHTVQAMAYDAASNVTQSARLTVKVDNTAPTVALTAPANGALVPASVVVTVDATDNAGVTRVEFLVDGVVTYTDTAAPYAWTWDATGVTGGHLLQAKGYDAAGNETLSSGVNVFVESEAPVVSVTAPAEGDVVRQTVTVTVSASDNMGIDHLELYVDGKLTASGFESDPLTWDTTAVSGTHVITVKAYDIAGNVTTSDPVTVVSDNQAPKVSISAPTTGGTVMGTVSVAATASDNRGVTRVEFYVDGALLGTVEASPFTIAWDTTAVTNGSHTLTARAWDAAGNVTTSTAVTVTVSN